MTTLLPVLVFVLGLGIVVFTLLSAVRTLVLPRGAPDLFSRSVFLLMRGVLELWVVRARSYAERDRAMAYYAPFSLLALSASWLAAMLAGYTCLFWTIGIRPWSLAFVTSGSSLLTLGFEAPHSVLQAALATSEAAIGLGLAALLISYLPAIYAAFARREAAVNMLEVRAGSPPSAVEMVARYHRIHGLNRLRDVWTTWETWFVDVEESHTSLAALAFFRSPQPEHSWITAAGTVLDTSALVISAVDIPHEPQADLCIRAGYLALRSIAHYFNISFDYNPGPSDPISIAREEFEAACDQLAEAGVPLKADREQAWHDFAGWRVNYDTVLLALAALTMAPYAPWSSDRSLRNRRPPRLPWQRR